MTNHDLPPDPFTARLPRVGQEAIEAVSTRLRKDNGLIDRTVVTLSVEQPDLSGAVAVAAQAYSRDTAEGINSMRAFALCYLLLDQQRQLDQQS